MVTGEDLGGQQRVLGGERLHPQAQVPQSPRQGRHIPPQAPAPGNEPESFRSAPGWLPRPAWSTTSGLNVAPPPLARPSRPRPTGPGTALDPTADGDRPGAGGPRCVGVAGLAGAGTRCRGGRRVPAEGGGLGARRAMKTISRPGRSGASRTSSTTKPAAASEAATSSRWRKRRMESEVNTAPSDSKTTVPRNETRSPPTSSTSTHDRTPPTPGTTIRLYDRSRVHSSHALAAGSRVSKTRRPPGRSAAYAACSVRAHSPSVRNTWATVAVIVTRPPAAGPGPWRRRAPTAPDRHRAWSLRRQATLPAGSTAVTLRPRRASRQAKVPVPQPMSVNTDGIGRRVVP